MSNFTQNIYHHHRCIRKFRSTQHSHHLSNFSRSLRQNFLCSFHLDIIDKIIASGVFGLAMEFIHGFLSCRSLPDNTRDTMRFEMVTHFSRVTALLFLFRHGPTVPEPQIFIFSKPLQDRHPTLAAVPACLPSCESVGRPGPPSRCHCDRPSAGLRPNWHLQT